MSDEHGDASFDSHQLSEIHDRIEYELLWPDESPRLELDHRSFSYAGKFVMTNTGKAVATDGSDVVGAASFNEDRTDSSTVWIRYITVHKGLRGEGIGPRLARFLVERVLDEGYDSVKIAVNNPFAYHALHKAGFEYTGEETGMAELVLASSEVNEPTETKYQEGLDVFRERELSEAEEEFLESKKGEGAPETVRLK